MLRNKKKILIFIVTYFASKKLLETYNLIPKKFIKKNNIKLLISDDDSKDNTISYAKQIYRKNKKDIFLKKNKKRLNYGGNIKSCLNFAHKNNYNYAIMLHGDGQYHPKYIPALINKMIKNGCSAIHGSRMKIKKSAIKGGMPLYKFFGNIILTFFFNFIFSTKFSDCHSGYWIYNLKYIKKHIYRRLTNGISFDNQLRISLVKKKLEILEIPIITIYKDEKKSFHLIYAIKFFFEVLINRFKK